MKSKIILAIIILSVWIWAAGFGIMLSHAENLDTGDPFEFIPDSCLCSDLIKLNGDVVGRACMCESTEEWPGKVLVFVLIPDGLDVMRYHLNDLADDINRQRLFERWGIKIK